METITGRVVILRGITENNGYKATYRKGKGTKLFRLSVKHNG